jgi:hypothetical protein
VIAARTATAGRLAGYEREDPSSSPSHRVGRHCAAAENEPNDVRRRARAAGVATSRDGGAVLSCPSGDRSHADREPLQHARILGATAASLRVWALIGHGTARNGYADERT